VSVSVLQQGAALDYGDAWPLYFVLARVWSQVDAIRGQQLKQLHLRSCSWSGHNRGATDEASEVSKAVCI